MFVPQIWLYGLAVVSAGILQAHGRFVAAAAAPLLSSAVVITTYLVYDATAVTGAAMDLSRLTAEQLRVLGWGTTLGVAALALTTVIPLARLRLGLRPRLRFAAGDDGRYRQDRGCRGGRSGRPTAQSATDQLGR